MEKVSTVAEKLYTFEQANNMISNSLLLGFSLGLVVACLVLWLFGKVRF